MNHRSEYLNYKRAYLDLQYGNGDGVTKFSMGENDNLIYDNRIHVHNLSDKVIDNIKNNVYTPMNGYSVIRKDTDKKSVFTKGVAHCVVLVLINEDHGYYMSHLLAGNYFSETLKSAFPLDDEDVEYIELNNNECKIGEYIKNGLPAWWKDSKTDVFIFGQGAQYMANRISQLENDRGSDENKNYFVYESDNEDFILFDIEAFQQSKSIHFYVGFTYFLDDDSIFRKFHMKNLSTKDPINQIFGDKKDNPCFIGEKYRAKNEILTRYHTRIFKVYDDTDPSDLDPEKIKYDYDL